MTKGEIKEFCSSLTKYAKKGVVRNSGKVLGILCNRILEHLLFVNIPINDFNIDRVNTSYDDTINGFISLHLSQNHKPWVRLECELELTNTGKTIFNINLSQNIGSEFRHEIPDDIILNMTVDSRSIIIDSLKSDEEMIAETITENVFGEFFTQLQDRVSRAQFRAKKPITEILDKIPSNVPRRDLLCYMILEILNCTRQVKEPIDMRHHGYYAGLMEAIRNNASMNDEYLVEESYIIDSNMNCIQIKDNNLTTLDLVVKFNDQIAILLILNNGNVISEYSFEREPESNSINNSGSLLNFFADYRCTIYEIVHLSSPTIALLS